MNDTKDTQRVRLLTEMARMANRCFEAADAEAGLNHIALMTKGRELVRLVHGFGESVNISESLMSSEMTRLRHLEELLDAGSVPVLAASA